MINNKHINKCIKNTTKALINGDIPIAAVIIDTKTNKTIYTYNQKEMTQNPCDHAEIIAIKKMAKYKHNWRLNDCILYVTLEPCDMCKAALKEARIQRVYYGVKSKYYQNDNQEKNKYIELPNEKCKEIIIDFFKNKRLERK